MTQYDIDNLRFPDDTEVDADSPVSETLMQTLIHNFEALVLMMLKHGDAGTLTSDPPNDTTGVLTDSARSFDTDEHNGRSILFTSGNAKNLAFTITDTTATTLTVSGTNLYDAGARSGDSYIITYWLNPNYGHTHNGEDSNNITPASASIAQANLKTSTGEVSQASSGANNTLPGGTYGFYPQIKNNGSAGHTGMNRISTSLNSATYVTNIFLTPTGADTEYAQQRYVTASGEIHWLFILRDYSTGKVISQYSAPDHPCFGNGGKPLLVGHPFPEVFEESGNLYRFTRDPETGLLTDSKQRVEIMTINPDLADVAKIEKARMIEAEDKPDLAWLEAFDKLFELDETKTADWPDVPVTVALPKTDAGGNLIDDHRFAGKRPKQIEPIKKVITKPTLVEAAAIKQRKQVALDPKDGQGSQAGRS